MSVLWIIILLTFVQCIRCQELIFANVLVRHGDRTIYKPYKGDKWSDEEFWPRGFGQLTNVGMRDQFELGKFFRKRYASLLGDGTYRASKFYVESTDADRAIMSALSTLAALFPPKDDEKFNEDLNWQPIPVHTTPLDSDYMLAGQRVCDRYDLEMQEFLAEGYYQSIFNKYRKVITYAEEKTGSKLETLKDLLILYDTLKIEQAKGLCIPKWAEKLLLPNSDFQRLTFLAYPIHTSTTMTKKLKAGFLLKAIFDRLSKKANSNLTPNRSLWMSFAHDITIFNILNSLGFDVSHQPPYSSALLFELYKQNDSYYVQLVYKKPEETTVLEIPGCGCKCTLEDLYDLYSDILPTKSFEEECALGYGEVLAPNGNPEGYDIRKIKF